MALPKNYPSADHPLRLAMADNFARVRQIGDTLNSQNLDVDTTCALLEERAYLNSVLDTLEDQWADLLRSLHSSNLIHRLTR